MKTAKEIRTAIELKELEVINWATKLIDDTSEKMFKKAQPSEIIDIDRSRFGEFVDALEKESVQQLLEENGFRVFQKELNCYLKLK